MTDQAHPGNDEALRASQEAIDEAKAAATEAGEADKRAAAEQDLPLESGSAAADGPAPAA
ncbi:hypothetical protein [Curtobacterium sp. MCSS17_015]|uniref:hypothetical protein n=1 Tax=Curtobacterium sp. MCSS17_015 TaxID=2175666 RepID=UPI000DA8F55B|nr:hypothetical protein [Curtobacterium sp. MCSS17_015]WIB26795.1 hypothetical protein DEJ18_01500 [Curtobacterium sp. MCSS17_015]